MLWARWGGGDVSGLGRGLAHLLSLWLGGLWVWGGVGGWGRGGGREGGGRCSCGLSRGGRVGGGLGRGLVHLLGLHWRGLGIRGGVGGWGGGGEGGGLCGLREWGSLWWGGCLLLLLLLQLLLLLLFSGALFGDSRGAVRGGRGGSGRLWGSWQAEEHPLSEHVGFGIWGVGVEVKGGTPSLKLAGATLHQGEEGVPSGPIQGSGGEPGQLTCLMYPVDTAEGAGEGEDGNGQLSGGDLVKLHLDQGDGACRAWGVAVGVELGCALASARHIQEDHAHMVCGGEGGAQGISLLGGQAKAEGEEPPVRWEPLWLPCLPEVAGGQGNVGGGGEVGEGGAVAAAGVQLTHTA